MFELSTIDPIRGKEDAEDDAYMWTDERGIYFLRPAYYSNAICIYELSDKD